MQLRQSTRPGPETSTKVINLLPCHLKSWILAPLCSVFVHLSRNTYRQWWRGWIPTVTWLYRGHTQPPHSDLPLIMFTEKKYDAVLWLVSSSPAMFCVFVVYPEEVCVNPMISYTDSCNCSDSSDIELSDEWVGKKSPKLSRGNRSNMLRLSEIM